MNSSRVRLIFVLLVIMGLIYQGWSFKAPRAEAQSSKSKILPERHLIICIDGVGFSLIQKMRAEGRFRTFQEPSRMISPFPTLTNVSMAEILQPAGAVESPGYEDNYFDIKKNGMRGGLLDRFNGGRFVKGTFRELFDYHPSALKSGLGYAAPPVSTYLEALSDLIRLRQKFRSSREPVYFAYTGATDSLAHLGGESLTRSLLARLDDTITDIVRESGGRTRVTIFSDHGNHFTDYRRVSLKDALRRAGMRLESKVRDERSVVLPQFGLIGCAVLFTKESNEARLAQVVSKVRGVDLVSYESNGVVHIVSSSGEARIEQRGESYRYRALTGDPLSLSAVARELATKGKTDAEGFISDAAWFDATRDGARPDAVRRIYDGASDHVRNRANLIINFADGYYSGSFMFDIFAILQAAHGNLGREQSFGFVMSTNGNLPSYIRAGDVWGAIGSPVLRKSLPGLKEKIAETAKD